jgi:hypothetical protein
MVLQLIVGWTTRRISREPAVCRQEAALHELHEQKVEQRAQRSRGDRRRRAA